MNHLIPQLLFERKQVGLIYHYTLLERCEKIVQSGHLLAATVGDGLDPHEIPAISFTRDKWLHKSYPRISGTDARMTFDGDVVSDEVRLTPYNYNYVRVDNKTLVQARNFRDESEERTLAPKVSLRGLIAIEIVRQIWNTESFEKRIQAIKELVGPTVAVTLRDEDAGKVKYVRWEIR